MHRTSRGSARSGGLLLLATLLLAALLVVTIAGPGAGVARAAVPETYSVSGYEIWFTPTVGVFAGRGHGGAGEVSAWYSSIEHSQVISPSGTIVGGWATLYRLDGVRISGHFSGGTVVQTNEGASCTTESHVVSGNLADVRRSDSTMTGTGEFLATLVHHRAWLFGQCISYAATVNGTIDLTF